MPEDKSHVIVYHGTSTAFDASIQNVGFLAKPIKRPSVQMNNGDHMSAFDGTYVATNHDTCKFYARKAVELYGGEPRIYALRVPVAAVVPDEDEVHYSLEYPLSMILQLPEEPAEDSAEKTPVPAQWTLQAARKVLEMLDEAFSLNEQSVAEGSMHLHAMIARVVGDNWDPDRYFLNWEENHGWSSPNWVRNLCLLEGGLEAYRAGMEKLLLCMKGAPPEQFPAGFESFKGRIFEGFKFGDNANGVSIIGYGTPGNAFEDYQDFSNVVGNEMSLYTEQLEQAMAASNHLRYG